VPSGVDGRRGAKWLPEAATKGVDEQIRVGDLGSAHYRHLPLKSHESFLEPHHPLLAPSIHPTTCQQRTTSEIAPQLTTPLGTPMQAREESQAAKGAAIPAIHEFRESKEAPERCRCRSIACEARSQSPWISHRGRDSRRPIRIHGYVHPPTTEGMLNACTAMQASINTYGTAARATLGYVGEEPRKHGRCDSYIPV
jgi:hypothetical protein